MGDPLNDTPFFNVKSKLLIDLSFKKKSELQRTDTPNSPTQENQDSQSPLPKAPKKNQHEEMNASTLQRWWDREVPEPKSRLFIQNYFFLGLGCDGDTIITVTIQNGIV